MALVIFTVALVSLAIGLWLGHDQGVADGYNEFLRDQAEESRRRKRELRQG